MARKFRAVLGAAFGAALALAGFSCARTKNAATSGEEHRLVILHTNDHHGSVTSRRQHGADGAGRGGLAERAAFVRQVRAANENVLLLDAGDVNIGMAVSNMFAAEPDILAYNALGYEAVTFGNHEFDGGQEKISRQKSLSNFAWLSANVMKSDGSYLGQQYLVKKYRGFSVGIFGLTTRRTEVIAGHDKTLVFADEIESARATVDFLRKSRKVDLVIALTHLGDVRETEGHTTSLDLAEQVEGLDLIIDGHSHSFFEEPKYTGGTPVVSAGQWGYCMGQAEITVQDGRLKWFSWEPVEITDTAFPPDAGMTALLKPYTDTAAESLKEEVMRTSSEFPFGNKMTRYRETASGDLLCDATVWQLRQLGIQVDFALHNGGNIRAAIPEGSVTREDIMTMLPFENQVFVQTLKGSDVIRLFDFVATINQGAGGFPQVSKEARYTLTYDALGQNGQISGVLIGGQPLDENRTYRIATNDYLARGGDGYAVLAEAVDTFNSSLPLTEVWLNYVRQLPSPIAPETDGRITVLGGVRAD